MVTMSHMQLVWVVEPPTTTNFIKSPIIDFSTSNPTYSCNRLLNVNLKKGHVIKDLLNSPLEQSVTQKAIFGQNLGKTGQQSSVWIIFWQIFGTAVRIWTIYTYL